MSQQRYTVTIVTHYDGELSVNCCGDQLRELLDMLKNGEPVIDQVSYGIWIPPENIHFVSFKLDMSDENAPKIVELKK